MISINHVYMEHTGGTKYYECVHLHDRQTKRSFVAFHWGAIRGGTDGARVFEFNSLHEGDAKFTAQIRAKKKRDYVEQDRTSDETAAGASQDDVLKKIEQVMGNDFTTHSKVRDQLRIWIADQHAEVVIEDPDGLRLDGLAPDVMTADDGLDMEELQAAQERARLEEQRRLEADEGWGQF